MCIRGTTFQNNKKPGSSSRPRPPLPPHPPPPPPQPRDGYHRPQRRDENVKPLDIDDYVQPCRDFHEGRRGADPDRDQAVARYLDDWQRLWEHMSPGGANGNGNGRFVPFALSWSVLTDGAAGGPKL